MERNYSLDIAKCFAIVSVIVYHIAVLGLYPSPLVAAFIRTYFLSIFFFISGYLTKEKNFDRAGYIKKKSEHLIIPFLVGSISYHAFSLLLSERSLTSFFDGFYFDDSKSGYWFLLLLFCFVVVLKAIKPILAHISNKYIHLFILFIPFVCSAIFAILLPEKIVGLLSLASFRRYYLFFVLGFCYTNYFKLDNIFTNKIIGCCSTICYVIFCFYYVKYIRVINSNIDFLLWFLTNFFAIHSWLFIFNKATCLQNNKILQIIGANTLGIYVLHYFPYKLLLYFQNSYNYISVIFGSRESFIVDAVVILFLMILILFLTYIMIVLVKKNKVLSFLILGNKKNNSLSNS